MPPSSLRFLVFLWVGLWSAACFPPPALAQEPPLGVEQSAPEPPTDPALEAEAATPPELVLPPELPPDLVPATPPPEEPEPEPTGSPEEMAALSKAFLAALPGLLALEEPAPDLSWEGLRTQIKKVAPAQGLSKGKTEAALLWVNLIEKDPEVLARTFGLGSKASLPLPGSAVTTVGSVMLPYGVASMWQHCQLLFKRETGLALELTQGWRSGAYQLWALARASENLSQGVRAFGPLGPFGPSGDRSPLGYRIDAPPEGQESARTLLFGHCISFGLEESGPHQLSFVGPEALYRPSLAKLPEPYGKEFLAAMELSHFYPSPEGLRVILSMAFQESSLVWDPALTDEKKQAIREQFLLPMAAAAAGLGGTLSQMVMPKRLVEEQSRLASDLVALLGRRSTEYDFYRWTRQTNQFIREMMAEYGGLAQWGSQFLHLEQKFKRLEYEPQTFGLWQLNVNHLAERIAANSNLRRKYPALFFKGGNLSREGLIESLSGRPRAPLNRTQTLGLVFESALGPRYQDHFMGQKEDLLYFAGENLTGELSSFKAAVQVRLSEVTGAKLTFDGDLSFSKPYSKQLDPTRTSQTQKALLAYAQSQKKALSISPQKAVTELCLASRRSELTATKLYRLLMKGRVGQRVFPKIRSELYQQSPYAYGKRVLARAQHF